MARIADMVIAGFLILGAAQETMSLGGRFACIGMAALMLVNFSLVPDDQP